MADKTDLALAIFQDRNVYARHCDELQAKVTNILVIVSAGILAFIGNNGLTRDKWPLAFFLSIIGLFGMLISVKLYERNRFYLTAAYAYKKELESVLGADFEKLSERIESEHQRKFPLFYKNVILLTYWLVLHLIIAILGLFLVVYIFAKS